MDVAIPVDDLAEALGGDLVPDGYYRDEASGRLVKDGEDPPKVAKTKPSPTIDELKSTPDIKVEEKAPRRRSGTRRSPRESAASSEIPLPSPEDKDKLPPYRAGVITRGMNKFYRKVGKIAKVMDEDIGKALIACTVNTAEDGDPDDSVGAAWDELCKVNPRVRRICLKLIQGGVYGQLFAAHAPVLMAIVMKDAIRKRIPFHKLLEALAEKDEDSPEGNLGGLETADLGAMLQTMGPLLQQFGMPIPVVTVPNPAAPGENVPPATAPPEPPSSPAPPRVKAARSRSNGRANVRNSG